MRDQRARDQIHQRARDQIARDQIATLFDEIDRLEKQMGFKLKEQDLFPFPVFYSPAERLNALEKKVDLILDYWGLKEAKTTLEKKV